MNENPVTSEGRGLYGLLAEFGGPDRLIAAAATLRTRGYQCIDAFSPMPIEGLSAALGVRGTLLPQIVLFGGVIGGLLGYGLQYYTAVMQYPINVGGRPLHSWQSFIPVTFELTILGAALFAVLGMLGANRLPQPHHPLFSNPDFSLASGDRFFLCIEAADPLFDLRESVELLQSLGASRVTAVEKE